ncbi:papain-like cysteine protease family protein [Streptomyces sp. BE308]|uniref:papain-like cysteine protease family protein n=1 Tax=unclassified Streptomyces TaxID=2593676 RepID=UPI002DD9DF2A|nr:MULTISPECIES: papain-like cysteine protease family protein [unclassified Streptomyces]MEE1793352.1 papain-like cysteine protease family protein [Streptomyces sp. BE308]WRZ71792.1 C39 family peptidase [Streptomyces sp. NBC_01237]
MHNRRIRPGRFPFTALLAAVLLAVPAATATAAQTPAVTPDSSAVAATQRLNITMQAQQKTNWCWAAAGNTIATWFGRNYSQNQFCNAAFNRSQGYECPNSQATLGNVQDGLSWAGVNPGSYVTGYLRYATVQGEISAGRPVETRIQWSSGGGHMHVLYGYDDASSWVYWGDPWPSSNRYNWASHAWYVNNNEFSWTHSLYRIGA